MDHLNDDERLDLANVVASARLEGQEVSMATRALMVEFLSGRLDAETAQRLVLEEALGSLQRFRPSAGTTPGGGIMKAMGSAAKEYPGPIPGGGYALRAVVVAADLDDLRGPVHGQVRLPLHLDASARQLYDLDAPYSRELMYRVVLLEAGSVEDLSRWLQGDTLVHCGPSSTSRRSYEQPGRSATPGCELEVPVHTCPSRSPWGFPADIARIADGLLDDRPCGRQRSPSRVLL